MPTNDNPFRYLSPFLICNTCEYKTMDDGIGNALMHAHLEDHKKERMVNDNA